MSVKVALKQFPDGHKNRKKFVYSQRGIGGIGAARPGRRHYMKPEQATLWLPVCFLSGKRDSSPRLCLGLSRAIYVTPAFLTEGCPSGASGSLVRVVVDQQQCETTALMAVVHIGAENETRTRDPDLGKVVLYQLSYFRVGLQR